MPFRIKKEVIYFFYFLRRCFPSPPLWRTLREQCVRWRHRAPLTEQWTRASLCLTARLLRHMYGPLFPAMPVSEYRHQHPQVPRLPAAVQQLVPAVVS